MQNGDTLDSNTLNPIQIQMPVINPELNNMNVFSMQNNHDTVKWKNTRNVFNRIPDYWYFQKNSALKDIYLDEDIVLSNIPVGRSYSIEYSLFNQILSSYKVSRPHTKNVSLSISKIDSNTLRVKAKLKYRQRGRRIIGKKNLDTTFIVYHQSAFYKGFTNNLNWINCDRFYDYKDKTDFYVNTPGIKGMNVIVYFKEIHAFMPAFFSGNRYLIPNVPSNMKVIVIAVGKKGEDFYFGKNETTIGKEPFELMDILKTNKEYINKLMDKL